VYSQPIAANLKGLRAWRRRLAWIGAVAAGLLVAVIGITTAVLGSVAAGRQQGNGSPVVSFRKSRIGSFLLLHPW
jgi:hypothetical protein